MTNTICGMPVVESEALEPGEMVLTDFSRYVVYTLTYTDKDGNEKTATGKLELQPGGYYQFEPM